MEHISKVIQESLIKLAAKQLASSDWEQGEDRPIEKMNIVGEEPYAYEIKEGTQGAPHFTIMTGSTKIVFWKVYINVVFFKVVDSGSVVQRGIVEA